VYERISLARAEIGYQSVHGVIHLASEDVITRPRRVPALMNIPVGLSITLLQRLQRPLLL
jgi:hypothetical protein